jgi:hypothetical protein
MHLDRYVAKKYLIKLENARQAGHEFTLTLFEFKKIVSRKNCFYTGVEMLKPIGKGSNEWNDLTLDRVDNSKGYVPGNVVACIKSANSIKGVWENPAHDISAEMVQMIVNKSLTIIKNASD